MKHKTKNRLIKKMKGGKTKKKKIRGGGFWDYFTSFKVGIPGIGSVGKCQSKQYYDPKYGLLTQTCTQTPVGPVYKTQYPDSGEATPTKSWYQFW
jgi:hypothetical protein